MANYIVSDTNLTAVANAIRQKGGTSASLEFPDDFVEAIGDIQTGGGSSVTVSPLSVTENGTYTAPAGTAYSPVTVSVSGSGTISLVAENLVNGWSGSTNSQNQFVNAKAPNTTTYTYVRLTGSIPCNLGDTVEVKLIDFGNTYPSKMQVYVASNKGNINLGTQEWSSSGFSFTGTNSGWDRDIVGFNFRDQSPGTAKVWSATVELYVNGVKIF